MADEPSGQVTDGPEPETVAEVADRQESLEDKFDRFIERVESFLMGRGSTPVAQPSAEGPDIAAEVQRGVDRVRSADERRGRAAQHEEWRASIDARLGKLENPEVAPFQINPLGRAFWGDPRDDK